jgi:hypothetical protein
MYPVKDNATYRGYTLPKSYIGFFYRALHFCGYRDKKCAEVNAMLNEGGRYFGIYSLD